MTSSNHPHHASAARPDVYGVLAVCAFVFGTAVLLLDQRAGASGSRALFLVVGLVSLAAALVSGFAATRERRRSTSTG